MRRARRARRAWPAALAVVALAVSACGDDEDNGSDRPQQSGIEADAGELVSCLGDADIDAEVNDSVAFGVETDHVGVKATDLPPETLKFDSGSGTLNIVGLWIFESAEEAEEARTPITLDTEDGEKGWVDGRVVVSWDYPVNREAAQAVAVDDCVAELNG
jgi:hypothetical protein